MNQGNNPDNTEPIQNKSSLNIGLNLSATELEAAPGGSVDITLKVRNLSIIVDRFHIKVEGLDPSWWTLSNPTFSFFPRDQGESKLTIHPPKEAAAMAGSYYFRVKAVSESNPQDETVVAAVLTLRGFVDWEVELSPTKVVGNSGTYNITAHNSGNADAVLLFEGKDQEESLVFNFNQNKITIPAGGSSQVKVAIHPKQDEERKIHNFQIISKQVGTSKEAKVLIGQLEYIPHQKSRWWVLPAALCIIGLILVVLGIVAGMYKETTLYIFESTPYESYMLPLIIVGSALIVTGITIGLRKKK